MSWKKNYILEKMILSQDVFIESEIALFRNLKKSLDEDLKNGRAEYSKDPNKSVYYTKGIS